MPFIYINKSVGMRKGKEGKGGEENDFLRKLLIPKKSQTVPQFVRRQNNLYPPQCGGRCHVVVHQWLWGASLPCDDVLHMSACGDAEDTPAWAPEAFISPLWWRGTICSSVFGMNDVVEKWKGGKKRKEMNRREEREGRGEKLFFFFSPLFHLTSFYLGFFFPLPLFLFQNHWFFGPKREKKWMYLSLDLFYQITKW